MRLAAWLESACLARVIVAPFAMIAALAPGRVSALPRGFLPRGSLRHRLDADAVFLVRALDLGGERLRDPLRNLELGCGVHDPDGADVALVDAKGEIQAVIEIMDSHATDSPRPEPWYEVRADDVFNLLNASTAANLTKRNTVIEPAPRRLPPLLDVREDEGVDPRLWLHRKGFNPWVWWCE